METRLDQVEKASLDSARLLQELAEQVEALSAAQERTARRDRIVIAISAVAVTAAIGALIVALS
jgi:hypothetical protein